MNGFKEFNEFEDGFFFNIFNLYVYMCIYNLGDC